MFPNVSRLDHLLSEKENLEKEFGEFQREVKHTGLADTAKEIKVLKKVIKNLEVNFGCTLKLYLLQKNE